MFMLDTNIVAAILKNDPRIKEHLSRVSNHDVCISVITLAEIRYGLNKRPSAKREALVDSFLKTIHTLPWTETVADTYGAMRARQEKMGFSLAPMDLQIAAHAKAENCLLVTNDRAFSQAAGLTVINWLDEG